MRIYVKLRSAEEDHGIGHGGAEEDHGVGDGLDWIDQWVPKHGTK